MTPVEQIADILEDIHSMFIPECGGEFSRENCKADSECGQYHICERHFRVAGKIRKLKRDIEREMK